MINVFNNTLKQQIKKNFLTFKRLSIIISVLFVILLLTLILLHNKMTKVLFIVLSTILFADYITSIYYTLKTYLYYNRLNKVVNSTMQPYKITGLVKELDSYEITVNGLSYKQYEVKHDITQVIYVLKGIDVSYINDKNVTLYTINNILYSYEVSNE